jgi:hypothetical protein
VLFALSFIIKTNTSFNIKILDYTVNSHQSAVCIAAVTTQYGSDPQLLQVRSCFSFLGGVYNIYDNTVYDPQGSLPDEGYNLT